METYSYWLLLGRKRQNQNIALNLFISYVAFKIYKYKMLCRLDSLSESAYISYIHVKQSIYFYSSVLGHLNENVTKYLSTFLMQFYNL